MARRVAVLIGASTFSDENISRLQCPLNDVETLAAALRDEHCGHFDDVVSLTNEPSSVCLEKIDAALSEADPGDLVALYYSGHGLLAARSAELHLACANTRLTRLSSTALPISWIWRMLAVSTSRRKILILDCCYSGAVGDLIGSKSELSHSVDAQLSGHNDSGTYILTATSRIEVSKELPGRALSILTDRLVSGLRTGEADRDGDGLIEMEECGAYVQEMVAAEGQQSPKRWNLGVRGRTYIARSDAVLKAKQRSGLRSRLQAATEQGLISEAILDAVTKTIDGTVSDDVVLRTRRTRLIDRLAENSSSLEIFVKSWLELENTSLSTTDSRDSRDVWKRAQAVTIASAARIASTSRRYASYFRIGTGQFDFDEIGSWLLGWLHVALFGGAFGVITLETIVNAIRSSTIAADPSRLRATALAGCALTFCISLCPRLFYRGFERSFQKSWFVLLVYVHVLLVLSYLTTSTIVGAQVPGFILAIATFALACLASLLVHRDTLRTATVAGLFGVVFIMALMAVDKHVGPMLFRSSAWVIKLGPVVIGLSVITFLALFYGVTQPLGEVHARQLSMIGVVALASWTVGGMAVAFWDVFLNYWRLALAATVLAFIVAMILAGAPGVPAILSAVFLSISAVGAFCLGVCVLTALLLFVINYFDSVKQTYGLFAWYPLVVLMTGAHVGWVVWLLRDGS